MVYISVYNRISFSLQKEGNPDKCPNMDEHWEHYAKWNKPGTKGQILSSYLQALIVKFIETESRMVIVKRLGGQENVGNNSLGT